MKTILAGTDVRLPLWNHVTFAKVNTVENYVRERRGADPAAALARARELHQALAWVSYAGSMLVGDDGGALHAQQRARAAAAITLEPEEIIAIEGRRYRVRVIPGNLIGPRNNDPIHLDEI